MSLDIILSFVSFFLTTTLSLFVLSANYRNKVNKSFFFLGFSISLWILSNILADLAKDYTVALFFARIAIIWTALLPLFFNKLIEHLYFENDKEHNKISKVVLIFSLIITNLIIFLSQTDLNLTSISQQNWGIDFTPGILYYILFLYLLISFGFAFINLFKVYRKFDNPYKTQAKLILIGSSITVIFSISMDIILPIQGYSFTSIFAPSTTIFFLIFTSIAILRHHLFNIKVIAIQMTTFALWIFMLIRVALTRDLHDFIVDGGLFIVVLVLGILLIQNVLQGIRHRKEIGDLTENLKKAYEHIDEIDISNPFK